MADDFADAFLDASAPIGGLTPVGAQSFLSRGNLEETGDRDWFQAFPNLLTAGVTYRITVAGKDSNEGTLDDPYLKLFGGQPSATPILQDNDSGVGHDSYLVYTPTNTFPYFFEVSSGTTGSGIGSYEIRVTALDLFAGAAESTFYFMLNAALPVEFNAAQVANLTQFAQTQFTFGQQIGVLNPTVSMYEALGLALSELSPGLTQGIFNPGLSSDGDFVTIVYDGVFGTQPNAAQAQHFLTQLDFYQTIYLASGAFGQDTTRIEILARGATIGQMLGVHAEIAINNAVATTGNLINDNGISTVGTSATMDFDLL
jgi:hypothetical protein